MKMKKIMAILAAACLSMAVFTGCGDDDDEKSDKKAKTSSSDKLSDDQDDFDGDFDDDDIDYDDYDDSDDSYYAGKWELYEFTVADQTYYGDDEKNGVKAATIFQFDLYDDNTCELHSAGETDEGTWKLKGDAIAITIDGEEELFTIEGDTLVGENDENDVHAEIKLHRVSEFTK